MPPARAASTRRAVTNENDENSATGTTRLTRSKSAAFGDDVGAAKKPLQSKKSGVNTQVAQPLRKRAALGDVSNVTKGDVIEGKKNGGKSGLVSKAAQPTGVQKNLSRTNSSRPVLGAKDMNKKSSDVKRTGSGSGAMAVKRKTSESSSTFSIKEETPAEEEQPLRKKIHLEQVERRVTVEEYKENEVVQDVEPKASVTQEFAEGVEDLDREDLEDPLMVAEYVVEIFDYLKKLEIDTRPNADYMDHQEDLEWKMRGILVDWLIEVHTRFHLLPETLFLAVNIIDRFLSTKVVQLDRLQLVGVTAMFIASKYEEVLSPHVANFRHVADDGFTEAEILSAERYVLTALNYDLSYPNPMNFLRRISKADNYDIQTRTLGKYLMEISLLDHRFMEYLPSHVAAASMYLARKILERGEWDPTLTHYAGYSEEAIQPVFKLMIDYLARPVTHEAFFKKYASKKFLKASILTRQWAKKHAAQLGVDVSTPLDMTAR
ncbi:A/B/D/E cyclin [Hyaloscypha variabilis]|uniref:A/B/D/E cyclin n=1 Tax=Hyaloscypha variabilis (strain UAMH 11265 / GT02V1 / F) TaxID=1149755 RepID=A0A2J6SCP8_HYAVF|nr:A/B/D/E cyclin [Hyaloscypha variabilis F]